MNNKKREEIARIRRLPGHMTDLENQFRETRNPLCPWIALHTCNREGQPPPEWVIEHLETCAEKLAGASDEAAEGKSAKRDANIVAKALGFSNGTGQREGWFKRTGEHLRRRRLYDLMVQKYYGEPLLKIQAAKEVAEEAGVSAATVVRAFDKMLNSLDR